MISRFNAIFTVLCFIFSSFEVEAKLATCRSRFKGSKFEYCTKFGAPSNSKVRVNFKSRLLNHAAFKPVEKDAFDKKRAAFIEFGVYSDQQWDALE